MHTTTDTGVAVDRARASDRARLSGTLSQAFYDDPVFRWIIPDDERRRAILPPSFDLFAEMYVPHGESYLSSPAGGAALWAPIGVHPVDETNAESFGERLADLCGPDAARMFACMEALEAHEPDRPNYHLQFLGVAPAQQGHGIGSALLRHVLTRLDVEEAPAYLEATSEHNARLYKRHGFDVISWITPEGGPTLYGMWRDPR